MIDINTDIKIAVAGCGSAGRNNIREFLKLDEVHIAACCDTEEILAKHTAQEFGIPSFYTDISEMLEEQTVDALIVAVPDGEHLAVSAEAFKRGIHVFCENPMASNYAEAVEMTRAARETGLIAVVNNPVSELPIIKSAFSMIKEGRIGRVKYLEAAVMQNRLDSRILDDPYEEKRLLWRLSSAAGSAGALGELGFSLYELAVSICGEPAEVSTMVKNIAGFDEIEEYQELDLSAGDTFVSQLSFSGGAAGVLRGSWTAGGPYEQITLSVYGEDASLSIDTDISESSYTLYAGGSSEKVVVEKSLDAGLHESFISAVKGEGVAVSDFNHGLKIQFYIEQSQLSNDGGLKLQLESTEEDNLS